MLDPLTALGVVGNIVQFLDFSIGLVGKAKDIYKSVDSSLAENLDVEKVVETVKILQSRLCTENKARPEYDSEMEGLLEGLCSSCGATAQELLAVLETMKIKGKKTAWKSMRQAIKAIKGEEVVLEITKRLAHFREVLEMTILVDLREKIDLQLVANSKKFETLETSTQGIILAVLENRSVFNTAIEAQSGELKNIYENQESKSAARHEGMKAKMIEVVTKTSEQQIHQHETTRGEIAQRAANEAVKLKVYMDKRTDEIKALIKETCEAKGTKERMQLKEKTNAAAASLVAMDLIYDNLMGILAKYNPHHDRQSWKLRPYSDGNEQMVIDGSRPSLVINHLPGSSSSTNGSVSNLSMCPSAHSVDATTSPTTEYAALGSSLPHRHSQGNFSPFQNNDEYTEPRQMHNPSLSAAWDSQTSQKQSPRPHSDYRPNSVPPFHGAPWPGIPLPQVMYSPGNQTQGPEHPYYYPPANDPRPKFQPYGPWSQTEPEDLTFDPEVEKKLLGIEEMMKTQKLDFERAQQETARKEREMQKRQLQKLRQKQLSDKQQKRPNGKKKIFDEKEYLNKKAAEEKAMWEKMLEEEKKAAFATGTERARKEMEAERKEVEAELAEGEAKAAIKRELEKLKEEAAVEARKLREEEKALTEIDLRARHIMIPWPSLWKKA
ncbi:hypothetical protein G7Y89_g210 [Cudoniella acicularis]|uniref:Fungal N-terminal domain-containing protein n=1 Tax=Cudoniella acicularis TaxID=354080 RepID=A0A8H4W8H9_9HELO|nr:hypothetical protein G7Y89_g210 [Cudoniella acicularis]